MRRALLLVRNAVEHDARVLRAAHVLLDEGARVLVVGVAPSDAAVGRTRIEGVDVVRVAGSLRGGAGRAGAGADASNGSSVPGSSDGGPAVAGPLAAGPPASPSGSVVPPPAVGVDAPPPSASAAFPPGWSAGGAARRTVRAAAYARGAIAVARSWRPDLVHANDHNTVWAALAIRRLTGARVLYDSHELWSDRNGRPEWRPGLLAGEALFVRAADGIITASPGYSNALAERHRVPSPPVVRNIPDDHGPRPDASPAPDPEVVYVGGLMPGRGLEATIDAVALVPGVTLRIVGPGPEGYAAGLRARAADRGVADRVVFAGAVAPDAVTAAAAGAWLGLAAIEPICRSYELTLPNKLFEYAHAGVPVLTSAVPVLAGVVETHGIGVTAASLSAEGVAAAIRAGIEPDAQRRMRDALGSFARENTWAAERGVLAAAYRAARAGG